MYISPFVVGLSAFVLGVMLTLFLPLGRARSNHLVSTLTILALFVAAAVAWLDEPLSYAIGAGMGLLAVLYRGLRRWLRYFQGAVYRSTHPYYWYGRVWRGVTRRRRRR